MQPTSVIFEAEIKHAHSQLRCHKGNELVGKLQEKHLSSPNSEISTLAPPENAKGGAKHSLRLPKKVVNWGQRGNRIEGRKVKLLFKFQQPPPTPQEVEVGGLC